MISFTYLLFYSPSERTADDLEIIYEELLHIKALSHLSTTVSTYCHCADINIALLWQHKPCLASQTTATFRSRDVFYTSRHNLHGSLSGCTTE